MGELLANVYRGDLVESVHRGSIAVVDNDERVLASIGDIEKPVFLRSALKPFQAFPLVRSGASDRMDLSEEEVAVATGSHSGDAEHLKAVGGILSKIKLSESDLQCGTHAPSSEKTMNRLRLKHLKPSPIHNNCSGKHAGMLARAVDLGASTDDYLEGRHVVQHEIRQALADLTGISYEKLPAAVDGCSAPTFALPLAKAAFLFARLANAAASYYGKEIKPQPSAPTSRSLLGDGKTYATEAALAKIARAMIAHPEMVAGSGRSDTEIMKIAGGALILKGGAEGVLCCAVVKKGNSAGIAIKIDDGNGRAAAPALINVLDQKGFLSNELIEKLESFRRPILKNHRKTDVGRIEPDFQL